MSNPFNKSNKNAKPAYRGNPLLSTYRRGYPSRSPQDAGSGPGGPSVYHKDLEKRSPMGPSGWAFRSGTTNAPAPSGKKFYDKQLNPISSKSGQPTYPRTKYKLYGTQ